MVSRNVPPNSLNASRVQPGQRDGKTVPELLLELPHHALGSDHKNAARLTPPHQLGSKDARLKRFTQTYGIRN
ncbi:hypothetical protein D3C74_482720 [compost metagenome]